MKMEMRGNEGCGLVLIAIIIIVGLCLILSKYAHTDERRIQQLQAESVRIMGLKDIAESQAELYDAQYAELIGRIREHQYMLDEIKKQDQARIMREQNEAAKNETLQPGEPKKEIEVPEETEAEVEVIEEAPEVVGDYSG